ncbi:uncharacterized protein EDB91DRAFT_6171 [Suillus paluster]|uniref:uncharacterized protein n=1 Tax=Suillus paluster TaxID=48578 RepID=UPI001B8635AC|nr:uncharacterized protein EDB91DRAFT_6171 [Suillus paluster]KAG1756304.1 hypothetical protein EDB91DRAFT_6171 [Suillus paluster]
MCAMSTMKKSSTKAADPVAKSAQKTTAAKSHHTTHPPWIDMITVGHNSNYYTDSILGDVRSFDMCENNPCPQECITTTPDGTRHGVSRPAIKKYHLAMNPTVSSQLNRAIHQGSDKGNFILPKGPSGKVKLAPRRHNEAAKENAKPASKRSTVAKEVHVTPIKGATKTAAKKTSRAAKKPAAATVPAAPPKSGTAEKKYHSVAKKARTTGSSTRRTAGRKAATAQGTAKKTVTGRTIASKTRRGSNFCEEDYEGCSFAAEGQEDFSQIKDVIHDFTHFLANHG